MNEVVGHGDVPRLEILDRGEIIAVRLPDGVVVDSGAVRVEHSDGNIGVVDGGFEGLDGIDHDRGGKSRWIQKNRHRDEDRTLAGHDRICPLPMPIHL